MDDLSIHYRLKGRCIYIDDYNLVLECAAPEDEIGAECQHNDARLIKIWSDVYANKPEVVHSRLQSVFGLSKKIPARQTIVKQINQNELDQFLTVNHMNVPTKARHKYGLFLSNRLVAVASFSKSCPIQRDGITYKSHELIRYGSLLNHTVVGGLSKLITHFVNEQQPEDIMTYVDKEWSSGSAFTNLDFTVIEETPAKSFVISTASNKRYYSQQELEVAEGSETDYRKITDLGNYKLLKRFK